MKKIIFTVLWFAAGICALSAQPAPNYLEDPDLSVGTKTYLKVLNASTTPVESLGG